MRFHYLFVHVATVATHAKLSPELHYNINRRTTALHHSMASCCGCRLIDLLVRCAVHRYSWQLVVSAPIRTSFVREKTITYSIYRYHPARVET